MNKLEIEKEKTRQLTLLRDIKKIELNYNENSTPLLKYYIIRNFYQIKIELSHFMLSFKIMLCMNKF